jgi:hypothetical protein
VCSSDLESFSGYSKPIQKAILLKKINYSISKEGLFDFFRKKNDQESKKKTENELEHYNELMSANKVSIHLYTVSVDDEIRYLEELISKGLPLFQKDYDRLMDCFNFIVNNHKDILTKIDKLVDIAWFDSNYNLSKDKDYLDFKTFVVSVGNNLADTKEQQAMIGGIIEWIDWDEMFPQATPDDIKRYEKLYSLQEAIPVIDMVFPRSRASKNQQRVYLEKDDVKLKKLLDLNTELIEKSLKINDNNKQNKMYELASRADKLTHPKPYGDGDENGMGNLLAHTSLYLYELNMGFKKGFISNYTAH